MKSYFGYIRVSTPRQGRGVSLDEQRSAIVTFAAKRGLNIAEWFVETETAARQGRTEFTKMICGLESGKATGVVIHKIDRGARNMKDWANLGELIDAGIDVQFAHESLDLRSRGGRLAADIQAVVAADYSRAERPPSERKPFFVYLDEFQNFTTLMLANMMSELRKYGVGLTLAHQHLHQLEPDIRHCAADKKGE